MKKLVQTAKTNRNGYFLIMAPKTVSSYAYHKCKVYLVWSPLSSCKKPSTLNGGKNGAFLRPRKSFLINKLPYTLYSVGPFGFEPTCPRLWSSISIRSYTATGDTSILWVRCLHYVLFLSDHWRACDWGWIKWYVAMQIAISIGPWSWRIVRGTLLIS